MDTLFSAHVVEISRPRCCYWYFTFGDREKNTCASLHGYCQNHPNSTTFEWISSERSPLTNGRSFGSLLHFKKINIIVYNTSKRRNLRCLCVCTSMRVCACAVCRLLLLPLLCTVHVCMTVHWAFLIRKQMKSFSQNKQMIIAIITVY